MQRKPSWQTTGSASLRSSVTYITQWMSRL